MNTIKVNMYEGYKGSVKIGNCNIYFEDLNKKHILKTKRKNILSVIEILGSIMIFVGVFVLLGLVGHMEFFSQKGLVDAWSMKVYLILTLTSLFLSTVGIILVRKTDDYLQEIEN